MNLDMPWFVLRSQIVIVARELERLKLKILWQKMIKQDHQKNKNYFYRNFSEDEYKIKQL